MQAEYLPSFIKDLKALRSTPNYKAIRKLVFEEVPAVEGLSAIANLTKLKKSQNAYRIRIGDYRIGFFLEGNTIVFAHYCQLNVKPHSESGSALTPSPSPNPGRGEQERILLPPRPKLGEGGWGGEGWDDAITNTRA